MRYSDLNELVRRSTSTGRYFFSLPVSMQIRLAEVGEYIHSAEELHRMEYALQKYDRAAEISEMLL